MSATYTAAQARYDNASKPDSSDFAEAVDSKLADWLQDDERLSDFIGFAPGSYTDALNNQVRAALRGDSKPFLEAFAAYFGEKAEAAVLADERQSKQDAQESLRREWAA